MEKSNHTPAAPAARSHFLVASSRPWPSGLGFDPIPSPTVAAGEPEGSFYGCGPRSTTVISPSVGPENHQTRHAAGVCCST